MVQSDCSRLPLAAISGLRILLRRPEIAAKIWWQCWRGLARRDREVTVADNPKRSDEAEAMRFLAIKAAIFILVPLIAAVLAVVFLMPE